jgi:hypothetical protein
LVANALPTVATDAIGAAATPGDLRGIDGAVAESPVLPRTTRSARDNNWRPPRSDAETDVEVASAVTGAVSVVVDD